MAQTSSASAAAALNWTAAESNIERFNNSYTTAPANTYGFKGFTENNMLMAKRPLRHQYSADMHTDANRYFRRDSPPDWEPSAKQPSPRMPSPPPPQQQQEQRQNEPDWMQTKRSSPPPVPDMTISPRYEDQRSHRHPAIRDPLGELTEDERRKKIEEHYIAKQDLEGVRQRREEQKYAKLEEQQKLRALLDADYQPYGRPGGGAPGADNRKMRFTEHQMTKPPSPKYIEPKSRYGVENRGEERVRSSMEQRNNVPERREDFGRAVTMPMARNTYSDSDRARNAPDKLRHQKNEIDGLRRSLNQLKHENESDTSREPNYHQTNDEMASTTDNVNEMLEGQSNQLKNLQEEINRLKAQDDLFYSPRHDNNPRAQSEPQTERGYRMRNRDGESSPHMPDFMQASSRRVPVGRMYNSKSTYVEDFNIPFGRRRYKLGNPNQETYEAYAPYGQEGSGAPRVNADGQRRTRITGALNFKDVSDPPKAGKEHKVALREENRRQAANDIIKKNAEMAHAKEGYVETVDVMRGQYVGYPKYNESGTIASHPLYHTFNRAPYTDPATKTQYHAFLASQIEEKNRNLELGELEARRQARKHFLTEDGLYGRHGGGNMKGVNLRKVNLNRAIHNPQSTRIDTRNYMGTV